MKEIYIVGSINTDLVITASRFPNEGETVEGSGFFTARGGKGANQAVAAARLGGTVRFCGCIGNDSFGEEALRSLQDESIDTSCIRTVETVPTGTAVIVLTDGNNRIILEKGANDCLKKENIDGFLENAQAGDIFLTQGETPIGVTGYALQKAKEKGMYVILNPAPASKEIVPYLRFCDLITPNETERDFLGGRDYLLTLVPTVLTTLGGDGFEIATKDAAYKNPCKKITPVDTTAAGDTLCGGLAARLSEGKPLEQAALFGSLAATIACTRKGAQPSIPTYEEVLNAVF